MGYFRETPVIRILREFKLACAFLALLAFAAIALAPAKTLADLYCTNNDPCYHTIYFNSMSYNPSAAPYGGSTVMSWSLSGNTDQCLLRQAIGSHQEPECYYDVDSGNQNCTGRYVTVTDYGANMYIGPVSGSGGYSYSWSTPNLTANTNFQISCYNYQGATRNQTTASTYTVPVGSACPVASFGSPWNSNSYLIYSGGVGSISNWYGRYCVRNYSGSAFFIPMATPTEWNNFVSAASGLNVGITAY